MKYLVLLYGQPITWSHARQLHQHLKTSLAGQAATIAQHEGLFRDITESGELLAAEPLAHPSTSRIVSLADGAQLTTEGPAAGCGGHLAGYLLLDCESLDRATAIASRLTDDDTAVVEIRPVMTLAGLEM